MNLIAAVTALAALLAADVASAAVGHAHRGASLHQASRVTHRQRPRLHATAAAPRGPAAAQRHVYRASADQPAGAPSSPGFYRSEKDREAGWGFHDGGMHTVVGLYQRPAEAGDIPGPQIYHTPEGRGAAGLSLSFKLGQ